MALREYEPAGLVHVVTCRHAPPHLLRLQASSLRDSHDRPHFCVSGAEARANRDVVVEPISYVSHDYVESTIWPDDAVRALCRTCRGTHPAEAVVIDPLTALEKAGLIKP